MKCPYCFSNNNYVYCGRFDKKLNGYIRYRNCTVCGQNFKTVERVKIDKENKNDRLQETI